MTMNLFALSAADQPRILRLPLSRDVQNEFSTTLKDQARQFQAGIDDEHEFEGSHHPESGELLKISNFGDPDGLLNAATHPLNVAIFDPEVHSVEKIRALFSAMVGEPRPLVLIQLFEQKRVLAKDRLTFFFEGNTFHRLEHAGFVLDTKLLAVLEGETLKFRNFHYLRRVFELEEFFHVATEAELKGFLDLPYFSDANHAEVIQQADVLVRKKVTLILRSGILEKVKPKKVKSSAKKFGLTVEIDEEEKIVLPANRAELKKLLKFLDEDYYAAPMSGTQYVSNSKRRAAN